MNFKWTEYKYLKAILKKMCWYVNADFYSLDFFNKDEPFYRKYSWTQDAHDSFIEWMTNLLYEDAKARKEIMSWPRNAKKYCRKAAEEFCWQFGWNLKDN